MPTDGFKADPNTATVPGTCSETRAAQAASQNQSPPNGYDTVWRGNKANPHPQEGGRPDQMAPCGNCSTNGQQINDHASSGSSESSGVSDEGT
jgi:hypothetical protein